LTTSAAAGREARDTAAAREARTAREKRRDGIGLRGTNHSNHASAALAARPSPRLSPASRSIAVHDPGPTEVEERNPAADFSFLLGLARR
jgi:hypothetical protein